MGDKSLQQRLAEMDRLFSGFYEWLAGQYDPASGGFYYARSSMRSGRYEPDIESTAQALNILERSAILESMPASMKQAMIRFFQNKQQPANGYFLDADPNMKEDGVMVSRAISYSLGSLRRLGGEPLYPLPGDAKSFPAYFADPGSYLDWLRQVDLRNSWRGCDRLATTYAYLLQMPEAEREPYLRTALDYFASIQDPATGLWGEGSLYVRISGTFKLHTFYSSFHLPMPNVDRIYGSILHCLRHEEAVDMCYIRNPINLLDYMGVPVPPDELDDIVGITIANMARLKRPDGGFSRELDHSPPAPNVAQVKRGEYYPDMPKPVRLGEGRVEGDMNAGTQAHLIRLQTYALAGFEPQPLSDAKDLYRMMGMRTD